MSGCEKVLFVSSVPWNRLWQRHQAMACEFAREFAVIYCEIPGVRRLRIGDAMRVFQRAASLAGLSGSRVFEPRPDRLRLIRPPVVPSTNLVLHAVNRAVIREMIRRNRELFAGIETIVTYTAARAALHLIQQVPHRRLVYECTDNFSAVKGVPRCFLADEALLLKRADLTVVPGSALAERHGGRARRILVLPHGVDVASFAPQAGPRAPRRGPVHLLYYGHMHRQHFDFELVDALARRRQEWRISLVGPVVHRWPFPANVDTRGPMPHCQLRQIVEQADVLILPYALNEYTRCVLPAKTYECLASGLPVVATPLPELRRTVGSLVRYAGDAIAFEAEVASVLAHDAEREARMAEASRNSWSARLAVLREQLAMPELRSDAGGN